MHMNMRGQSKLGDAIPHAFRPMGVVVSGKKMPLDIRERFHPLNRCSKRNRIRRFIVVDITGDQDVPHAVWPRQLSKPLDCSEPRLS